MNRPARTVCVYCASSPHVDPLYIDAATQLGRLIGSRGWRAVNGAGATGLMRALADAVVQSGGTACGVIPQFMVDNGWQYGGLSECIRVATMHERKRQMAAMSDAAIALPGGYGTMEELLEIVTWKQLGLYPHPVVILNTNRYYDPLIAMLHRAAAAQFVQPQHAAIWLEARTPEEAISLVTP
jgi:uncharacterized protein (TIGR00730 family)